jgi:hypothetical protein
MAHTITITRLPDEHNDDADYEVAGACDNSCTVWRECEAKHPRATEGEESSGKATWHGVEHMAILGIGWCVIDESDCGLNYAYGLGLEAAAVTEIGTYALDIDWDGDGWVAYVVVPTSPSSGTTEQTGA